MAVPRNRHSVSRQKMKRAHQAKKPKVAGNCANCGTAKLPHRVCMSCGFYRGKAVIETESESE